MRDRRWDFLYEKQKQPVKELVLERFAGELAGELRSWPPPLEWVSEELRRRHAAGLEAPPSPDAVRFAFELARLDLAREFEGFERRISSEGDRHWRGPAETAAGHLLVRYLTERCLALKEEAYGAKLSRADLVRALEKAEQLWLAGPPTG